MPAIRFFAIFQAGREQAAKKSALDAVMLCDVSSISLGDGKYYEELRKFYLGQAVGHEKLQEDARKRAIDPTSEAAKTLVTNLFDQAQRLN